MSKYHSIQTARLHKRTYALLDDLVLMLYKEASETRKSNIDLDAITKEAVALVLEKLAERLEGLK